MKPVDQLGVLEAARAIEAGALTSEALVRACLERIAERNDQVLAFTAVDPALALRHAHEADQRRDGLLRGIPFAVKDVIDTADYVTSYGSPIHAGHRPRTDAACVAVARERGAVVLGKAATSEFATQTPSSTRNPLNLEHTPGGSSSGSAAAVADGMVPVAFGTQTTGSIIRPASYCGVVGYKPTYGFFDAAGLKALSPMQDTIGVLARSVDDVACFSLGFHGARAAAAGDVRPRLAVCQSRQWDHAHPEMADAVERLAADAERGGATVTRIRLPAPLEALVDVQGRLFAFEARQSLAHERVHDGARFSTRLQQRLAGGLDVTLSDYLAMRRRVLQGQQEVQSLFAGADVLLYPSADGEAESGIVDSGSPRFGALWTLLQLPCISLPAARGPGGLPLGVQAIGPYGDDERMLAVAGFLWRVIAAR